MSTPKHRAMLTGVAQAGATLNERSPSASPRQETMGEDCLPSRGDERGHPGIYTTVLPTRSLDLGRSLPDRMFQLAQRFGDRQELPLYAGRGRLIRQILESAREPSGDGRTFVVEDAPGAGKTALLNVLLHEARKGGIHPLFFSGIEDASDIRDVVLREIVRSLDPGRTPPVTRTEQHSVEGKAGIRIPLVPVSANLGATTGVTETGTYHEYPQSVLELERQYLQAVQRSPELSRRRVLLLLDEAQGMNDSCGGLVRQLHGAKQLPVLTVLSGTQKLSGKLSGFDLTRIDPTRHCALGPLTPPETHAAIEGNLARGAGLLGIDPGVPPEHVEQIVRESNGWPQHVVAFLQGTWLALAERGADRIDEEITRKAIGIGRKSRETYYSVRLERTDMNPIVVDAAIGACEDGGPVEKAKISHAMRSAHRGLSEAERIRHDEKHGSDANAWTRTLVHNGLLFVDPADPGRVRTTSIPSMRSYVRSRADANREIEADIRREALALRELEADGRRRAGTAARR